MGHCVGHGGDTTAIHAVDTIPKDMRSRLSDALAGADAQTTDLVTIVPRVIQASLTAFEEGILADFMALFPGGLPMVEEMSAEEIKAIVNDDGENLKKVHRCMRGTTALIALVDPRKENVWVASLGDGQASELFALILALINTILLVWFPVLSSKDVASNAWKGHVLCGVHNGFIQSEVERIRAEHPGEEECVIGFRVLGAIMVTRGASSSNSYSECYKELTDLRG